MTYVHRISHRSCTRIAASMEANLKVSHTHTSCSFAVSTGGAVHSRNATGIALDIGVDCCCMFTRRVTRREPQQPLGCIHRGSHATAEVSFVVPARCYSISCSIMQVAAGILALSLELFATAICGFRVCMLSKLGSWGPERGIFLGRKCARHHNLQIGPCVLAAICFFRLAPIEFVVGGLLGGVLGRVPVYAYVISHMCVHVHVHVSVCTLACLGLCVLVWVCWCGCGMRYAVCLAVAVALALHMMVSGLH